MRFGLVFPGQGSQSVGMMTGYGDSPSVRQVFDEASLALGVDLWQMAAVGPIEALNLTVNTQPLMLTADVAVFRLWKSIGGPDPEVVAGHSLGEYSALVAAGALTLADAVPLVKLRAEAMQGAVPAGSGAMAAVMGLDAESVRAACAEVAGTEVVEAVNFNEPAQTVIAGHKAAVERAADAVKARGAKRALMLPVSAPFHCSLMHPAADALAVALDGVEILPPRIRVINNVDVEELKSGDGIRQSLIRQAAAPVRWVETMIAFERLGVSHVFECGPGKVLSGLVKRCSPGLSGHAMNDEVAMRACLAQLSV